MWAIYPLVVSAVVVVTANHWIFDAVTGAAVAVVAAVAAQTCLPAPARTMGVGTGAALAAPARAG